MPFHHKPKSVYNLSHGWYLARKRNQDGYPTGCYWLIHFSPMDIYWNTAEVFNRKHLRNEWVKRRWLTYEYIERTFIIARKVQVNPPHGDRWPLVKEVSGNKNGDIPMPHVTGMAKAPVGTRRDMVKYGQTFKIVKKDGTLGDNTYGVISQNGKFYSINLDTGELASTRNGAKPVKVTGKYTIKISMLQNGDRRPSTRGRLRDNELFVVKGGKSVYANLGVTAERKHIALNLGNENHAVTTNSGKNVVVVGTYTIEVNALKA